MLWDGIGRQVYGILETAAKFEELGVKLSSTGESISSARVRIEVHVNWHVYYILIDPQPPPSWDEAMIAVNMCTVLTLVTVI